MRDYRKHPYRKEIKLMKKPRKAKTFKYISPLNDVPNGHAKMMAELAEQAMLLNIAERIC